MITEEIENIKVSADPPNLCISDPVFMSVLKMPNLRCPSNMALSLNPKGNEVRSFVLSIREEEGRQRGYIKVLPHHYQPTPPNVYQMDSTDINDYDEFDLKHIVANKDGMSDDIAFSVPIC